MADKTYQTAKFYSLMFELKSMLNSDLLPLAVHIGAHESDPQLFESLELLATDIGEHLKNYQLTVTKSKLRR